MRHVFAIALKDLRITLRDRTASVAMLATPLMLAIILGAAFGSFGGSHSGLQVIVVDEDGTPTGGGPIVSTLTSPDLASLLTATVSRDAADARAQVDHGTAVAVIVPPGVGAAVTGASATRAAVEVYANPSQPLAAGIVRTVVDGVLARLNAGATAGRVTAAMLQRSAVLLPGDGRLAGAVTSASTAAANGAGLTVASAAQSAGSGVEFGRIVGPSMAVLFLMFTVTAGARRMLEERDAGTLSRLLVSPGRPLEILVGKGVGIYLVGAVQMTLLLAAVTVVFGIAWSSLPALVLLTMTLIFAATAWGVLIAGVARTPAQANQAGTAVTIVFGMTAGNFVPRANLPEALRTASLITPNGVGLEGYGSLVSGGDLTSIAPEIAALVGLGIVILALAAVASRGRLVSV